jgi:hypothetical protein
MKHGDIQSGIFLLLISVFASVESLRMGIGKLTFPGPGFLPFLAGVVLGCLSILLIITTYYKRSFLPARDWYKEVLWQRWSIAIISIVLWALLLEYLGFIICTIILIAVLIISVEAQRWKLAFIVTIVGTVVLYLFFQIILKTQLPMGFLRI